MYIFLDFHLDEPNKSLIPWKFLAVSPNMTDFLFDIRKSNTQKRVELFENIAKLIKNLTKLIKRYFAMLFDSLVDDLKTFDGVCEIELCGFV